MALPQSLNDPTQQPNAPTQRPHAGRESSRVWTVLVVDEQGNTKKIQMTKPSVFEMPRGERIVVSLDRNKRAYGEAASLLSGACERIVNDSRNVPINFDSWPNVPKTYKRDCFNTLKNLFHFQASESVAQRYCYLTMARKYRNGKKRLWDDNFDPSLSREHLIAKVPAGIHKDQWSSFVDYHFSPEYKKLCQKNIEIRKKQIPHTGGSKLLSTKQHEMEVELGRFVSRGELFIATHKKKDGSYISEDAKSIGEKLTQEMIQSDNSTEISSNDALAKVMGKDHCGRVRCLGLGGLHSVAFKSSTRFSGEGSSSSNFEFSENFQLKKEVISLRAEVAASEDKVKTLQNVMLAYIQMKEGHVPPELLSVMFNNTSNPMDEESGQDVPTPHGRFSFASNPNGV